MGQNWAIILALLGHHFGIILQVSAAFAESEAAGRVVDMTIKQESEANDGEEAVGGDTEDCFVDAMQEEARAISKGMASMSLAERVKERFGQPDSEVDKVNYQS